MEDLQDQKTEESQQQGAEGGVVKAGSPDDQELSTRIMKFILDKASDAVYIFDEQRQIIYANQVACEKVGYSREELLTMNISDLDPFYPEGSPELFREKATLGEKEVFETVHLTKSGEKIPVEISRASSLFDGVVLSSVFVRDISKRIKDRETFRQREERFRLISDTSPVALMINRISDGCIQYANKQTEVLFGKSEQDLLGSSIKELFSENDVEKEVIEFFTRGVEIQNRELLLTHDKENKLWITLNSRVLELEGETVICSAMLDVSEARELSNQLSYQAAYDDLTGLVNRREFENRLGQVIYVAHERRTHNALCYLDLDQFKIINDTCGHMAGDQMLKQLSQLLARCIRADDTLARLGGDEFAILLENCSLDNARQICEKMRKAVNEFRFSWEGSTFNISVSIGLTPITSDGETLTDALRRADSACYAAKDAGRNRIHVFRFDDEELARRDGEMRWVAKITAALDEGRLELWHQEIHHVEGSGLKQLELQGRHFEFLLRMREQDGGLVMPGAFLPAAERYDLASRLDRWVVGETFNWFQKHPQEMENLGMCAINISGQSLGDEKFLNEIIAHFENSGTPPGKICFEITETAAIANLSLAASFMTNLKDLGCFFALDDFGSGLSSFSYLKNLPVDFVKIDGSFIKDVATDEIDLAMVKAINDMAHAMGKMTIAEFVEDDDILQELTKLGVDYVQGYGIAKPIPFIIGNKH